MTDEQLAILLRAKTILFAHEYDNEANALDQVIAENQ